MPRVTVVPADRLIIVDGEALRFDFPAPANLHALQWDGDKGHMEWTDDYNMVLDATLYSEEVAPYVALWQAEKARLVAEAEAAEAARLEEYNSAPARYARLRAERDARMAATDYLIMPDYPLPDEAKAAVTVYRQALRDLPAQDGAPWDGGGEDTPWPSAPEVARG
ncbi:tail fiber assembly protein [uncultured Desulfovibrio sp.]|uniref:tail fiber assembly protein n=1 Tax=uncultured Desulfovibrio sp. TaxID=167968 RepID=UPI002605FECA|nr:tail fiber assembly protein [uncultured Desulfovibrio sp.]